MQKEAEKFVNFINRSPSPYHAAAAAARTLSEHNFQELKPGQDWQLERGEKYYTVKNGSTLIAWTLGEKIRKKSGFRIIGAHTDSPGFKVKPNPEMIESDSYLKLNTEPYGGVVLRTWLDRPLSLAGRVFLKGDSPLQTRSKLVNIKQPLLIIPGLAIHLNREVNKGQKLDKQEHMLPLMALVDKNTERGNFLEKYLASRLDLSSEDIIDFDLFLYASEESKIMGAHNEFISSGRMDDQAMAHAALRGLINSRAEDSVNVICLFDSEEIGSHTSQGAASPFLKRILTRIHSNLSGSTSDFHQRLDSSFLISADMAHGHHPNKTDDSDPTNRPILNKGPAIKSAPGGYITEGETSSVYKEICRTAGIPCQTYTNRSGKKSGRTIGPILAGQLDIRAVDVGNPLLAMHSVRELGGVQDHHYIIQSFKQFFSLPQKNC